MFGHFGCTYVQLVIRHYNVDLTSLYHLLLKGNVLNHPKHLIPSTVAAIMYVADKEMLDVENAL
jgi:hypothetical protein